MDYAGWVADGSPYIDCDPNMDLARVLRGYGYTVYTRGDTAHMKAQPPEDHTPFSATGWPVKSPYPYGHACDIMPPPQGSGLPSLAELGRQMFDDRTGEVPGARLIKYMNWEPNGPGGSCYHDSWQPDHRRTASGDRGHIHVSWRSDATHTDLDGYDPVARIQGDDMPTAEEIAKAVWNQDQIPAPKPPNADADFETNPTWQADNALCRAVEMSTQAARVAGENAAELAALTAAVAALETAVDELLSRPAGSTTGTFATSGTITISEEPPGAVS